MLCTCVRTCHKTKFSSIPYFFYEYSIPVHIIAYSESIVGGNRKQTQSRNKLNPLLYSTHYIHVPSAVYIDALSEEILHVSWGKGCVWYTACLLLCYQTVPVSYRVQAKCTCAHALECTCVPAIDGLSRDTEHKHMLVMLGPGGGLNIWEQERQRQHYCIEQNQTVKKWFLMRGNNLHIRMTDCFIEYM